MTTLRDLRRRLAEEYPEARPLVERDAQRLASPVPTGIEALDRVLPGGGLPRGKLTVWAPDGGSAAVLRAACRAVLAAGERAAWIDASRTATFGWDSSGLDFGARGSGLGDPIHSAPRRSLGTGPMLEERTSSVRPSAMGPVPSDVARDRRGDERARAPSPGPRGEPRLQPLLVHPPDRLTALRGAELLLRSGAFGLVVLEGAEAIGTEIVRLTRSARDGGGAFVALTPATSMAALRITSRLITHGASCQSDPFGEPAVFRSVRAEVRARSLGWNAKATLRFRVAPYELRHALEPGVDRRGASRP